jgi:aspartate aminotransferase
MAAEYRRRRDFVHAAVAAIPGVTCSEPEGGFYVFPDVSRCLSRRSRTRLALCQKLLEEQAVAVVPGEGFHAPGFFRLSFAAALRGPAGGRAADRRVPRRARRGQAARR